METTITKEQAMQWLMAAKRKKQTAIDRLTQIAIKEFERKNGIKPTYIESL